MEKAARAINFMPVLEEQTNRYEGDIWIRRSVAGKNLGSFYTSLYAALFGGEVSPLFKGRHDVLPNGELRMHTPDIIKESYAGATETEVKSISLRDNRISISREQLENYFNALLVKYCLKKEKYPEFELGVFRYGNPHKYVNLHFYSTEQFMNILFKSTHELVIMPSNLALFSFMCSRHSPRNRAGTKSETKCTSYHRYDSKFLSSLANAKQPIDYLLSVPFEYDAPEAFEALSTRDRADILCDKLLIDKLDFKRFSSENIGEVKSGESAFVPFRVTQFFMQDKYRQKWLRQFAKHHRYILEDLVGVRDLYQENHGVPF